jgi:hypothetical protein
MSHRAQAFYTKSRRPQGRDKTTQIIKVNHKHNLLCGIAMTSRQNSNGLNAICIAFIPNNCILVFEEEGIMILKMSGTCHPVTQHDKAFISCVLVGLSNF